jgi:hypothetical protein
MRPIYALSSNHNNRSGSALINKYSKYFYYENYDYKEGPKDGIEKY